MADNERDLNRTEFLESVVPRRKLGYGAAALLAAVFLGPQTTKRFLKFLGELSPEQIESGSALQIHFKNRDTLNQRLPSTELESTHQLGVAISTLLPDDQIAGITNDPRQAHITVEYIFEGNAPMPHQHLLEITSIKGPSTRLTESEVKELLGNPFMTGTEEFHPEMIDNLEAVVTSAVSSLDEVSPFAPGPPTRTPDVEVEIGEAVTITSPQEITTEIIEGGSVQLERDGQQRKR